MSIGEWKNILITGASSGLGAGMARQFAARGRNLALCARRIEQLDELAAELRAAHPAITVLTRRLDVNEHGAVSSCFGEFREELGRIDRVIANAGLGKGQPLGTGHFTANAQTAHTNFIGLLAQCEAALEIFHAQHGGHLVVVSSFSALRGFGGNRTVYAASKAAATTLAEGIRAQHLHDPVAVTTLLPGFIESEMTARGGKSPLITRADKGARALITAIEKEPAKAYVPRWPWALLSPVIRFAPLRMVNRLG